jgi:hypothetical protein
MLALSLFSLAALFIATVQAGSFGKNVVPYIPQVYLFYPPHPHYSFLWAVLINLAVIFL